MDNERFGPTAGDAFIAMWGHDAQWDHGSVVRVDLTKKVDTYDAKEYRVSEGPPKVSDLSFGSDGTLYVAQFGTEGSVHTPYRDGPMWTHWRTKENDVHFSDAGSRLIGKFVARCMRQSLP